MHGYEPFWKRGDRTDPTASNRGFTEREHALLTALWDAHQAVAMRGNASGEAFKIAFAGSGDYTKALAGALATLGAKHGPISDTCKTLTSMNEPLNVIRLHAICGKVIPGWGNALVKGRDDPDFLRVRYQLEAMNEKLVERIDAITGAMHARGKRIYPNPSCWTAAGAITVGLPAELSPYLFIAARLPVWSRAVMA